MYSTLNLERSKLGQLHLGYNSIKFLFLSSHCQMIPGMKAFQFKNFPNPYDAPASTSTDDDDTAEFQPLQADAELQFISRMLLEEDEEESMYMLHGDPALISAVEKPFLDILYSTRVPVSPELEISRSTDHVNRDVGGQFSIDLGTEVDGNSLAYDGWNEQMYSDNYGVALGSKNPEIDELPSAYVTRAGVPYLFDEIDPEGQFHKGVEEASIFLPDSRRLDIDATSYGSYEHPDLAEDGGSEWIAVGGSRRVKSQHDVGFDLREGWRAKQPATHFEDDVPKKLYDEVLLGKYCRPETAAIKSVQDREGDTAKGVWSKIKNSGGKLKGRKQPRKDLVDLRSLLILCAQSISTNDRLSANQQLNQIRQHSSSTGDGSQRLAHYLAGGLEARLAGTGSEIYRSRMMERPTPTADILKAYHLYIQVCPFKNVLHTFANQIILRVARKAARIHIVEFGMGFGFHFPCLIQTISKRPSGIQKLRITGIDFPQPGFRPGKHLEETGRRLAEYAREFNVPFEYHSIATKWENVKIADLDLKEDELLIVSCLHLLENVADESISVGCPRDIVLNRIKRMNPAVFIHGIVNGAYSSPFFLTRFREALFYFSSVFDAFDCIIDRENPHRLLLEREFLGQKALNVIACEGTERLHRPETYKQWQVRNQRCGFIQLPLDAKVAEICQENVTSLYNKEFLVDTDGKWMVQGWKGRVLYAVSAWKPACS